MHRAWLQLLLMVGVTGLALAQPVATKPRAQISERLAREIRSTLPEFDPAAAERRERPARLDPGPSDPNVITLPEVLVEESQLAVRAVEQQEREKAQRARLKRQYLANMGRVASLLNSWAIPFLGVPVEAQAEGYANREMARAKTEGWEAVAETVATTDPDAGAGLKKEIHILRHGTHPPGWPPIRP